MSATQYPAPPLPEVEFVPEQVMRDVPKGEVRQTVVRSTSEGEPSTFIGYRREGGNLGEVLRDISVTQSEGKAQLHVTLHQPSEEGAQQFTRAMVHNFGEKAVQEVGQAAQNGGMTLGVEVTKEPQRAVSTLVNILSEMPEQAGGISAETASRIKDMELARVANEMPKTWAQPRAAGDSHAERASAEPKGNVASR